jgi:hypothetical protein
MMAKLTKFRVLMALMALVAASVVGVVTAAPPDQAQNEHQRVVEFWTNARVAQAVPRDFVLDANGLVPRGKPEGTPGNRPGGGGGEDDEGTTVKGASWEVGGDVAATTGKVLFEMSGSYYVCSASVVADDSAIDGDSLVLTAAHCAYDETNEVFATNWMFIPDYDSAPAPLSTSSDAFCDDTKYGCWVADALTVHDGYASAGSFNQQAITHDFAFATMSGGGHGAGTALLDVPATLEGAAAPSAVFDTLNFTVDAYAFGYPAAKKYKGKDLVYCAGPVSTDANMSNLTYRLECGMTGGSSGGPWFSPFAVDTGTLSSVNSYGYRGGDSMYGPMFNSDTAAVYAAADGATENNDEVGAPAP